MSNVQVNKNELNAQLNYFIENKRTIGIVVYAVVKGSNIPKKLDIERDAQVGLKELFLNKIKESIIDNNELGVMPLSSSDERSKIIYQYDLALPEDLTVLNEVTSHDEHPDFIIDDDGLQNIKVLLIEIGDQTNQLVLYKTMAPVNIFTRSSFFLKKSETRFEKIDNDFFRISDNFQLLKTSSDLFVIDLETIEKSFSFHEVIKREAALGMVAIAAKNIISNMAALEELIQDVKYARKLTKVAKSSPVLKANISNDKIINFCQIYPTLRGKIRFNDDGTQILLDTKVSKDLFIKVLMDDFLMSELTDFYYNSIAKDKEEVSIEVVPDVA